MQSTTKVWNGSDEAFFELLTKFIFYAGFSKRVVNRRWVAFQDAFCAFQIGRVASFDEVHAEWLVRQDSGIIRNTRKVHATIVNARVCMELVARYGSLQEFVNRVCSQSPSDGQTRLRKTFSLVGESTALALWRELHEEHVE